MGKQSAIFNCVTKETLITVEYIDLELKSWSECADAQTDLDL